MSTQFQQIRSIFLGALERPMDEWSSYLEEVAAGDDWLREQVRMLLDAHAQGTGLLDKAVHSKSPPLSQPITEKPGTQIGPYKLLQEIGQGGMGVVFMAEQREPVRRKVALKIIKPGMDTRQVIARFEAERQVLALMDHPNIAKVLDAGTTESGRPYFVMELVAGEPITRYCDKHHLTPRERLELFIPTCQAVQHAHLKGIIHRDIKPSNILVARYDGRPVPKVIDFGVAKATGGQLAETPMFTGLGQIIGTAEYMSPEQADPKQLDIDTRSDVYSLGVVLYELLSGDTPFDKQRLRSAAWDEMLRIIREEEPPRPSTRLSDSKDALPAISAQRRTEPAKLAKLIQGELDWIVMKALEKDRNRRYESANFLAADVRHYLDDEPVDACPPTLAYRLQKFVLKNRVASFVWLTLILGSTLATAGMFAAIQARIAETAERRRAEKAELAVREQRDRAMRALRSEELQREKADRLSESERALRRKAEERERDLTRHQRYRYAAQMTLAQQDWELGSLSRMLEVLNLNRPQSGKADLRSFEWFHLWRLGAGDATDLAIPALVRSVAISPDSGVFAVGGEDGSIGIWSVADAEMMHIWPAHAQPVVNLAFVPNTKLLVSVSGAKSNRLTPGEVKLWNWPDHRALATLDSPTVGWSALAMTADGRHIATAADNESVAIWDLASQEKLATFQPWNGKERLTCLAYSPDGETLAVGSLNGKLAFFDARTQTRQSLHHEHFSPVLSLAYSSDGQFVASGGYDGKLILWNLLAQTHQAVPAHLGSVNGVTFSSTDEWVVSGGNDQTVTLWRLPKLTPWMRLKAPTTTHLALSPDGRTLIVGGAVGQGTSRAGRVRVWDLERQPKTVLSGHTNFVLASAFSPTEGFLATAGVDRSIRLWSVSDGRELTVLAGHVNTVNAAQCAHKSAVLVSVGIVPPQESSTATGEMRVWNLETRTELLRGTVPSVPYGVDISPDDSEFAVACADGMVRRFALSDAAPIGEFLAHAADARCVRYSPGGGTLATCSSSGAIKLLERDTGKELWSSANAHSNSVWAVRFSPDGRVLASVGLDKTARLWDARTGKPMHTLHGHPGGLYALTFTPDGKRLATGGTDGLVKLWDTATGEEVITLKDAGTRIWSLDCAADGSALAAGLEDGTVRLWRTSRAEP